MATKKTKKTKKTSPYVVIRTYSAGVHVGELVARTGSEALLRNARRLWSWSGGRLSLHEVATEGARSGDRISVAISEITLVGVIEVLATTADGEHSLRVAPPYKS